MLRPPARPEQACTGSGVPIEIYLNVAASGLLTGLVYGLMALGLSVIFGVVRVVNFAHGEMMTVGMYIAILSFAALGLDPLVMMVPIAAILFVFGYLMQVGLINPFINRPEHSQFMLLVAVALILVNVQLIVFGPDAQGVQTSYSFDSYAIGPLIVDASKVYAAGAALAVAAALFAFFRFTLIGKSIRACADNYHGALVVGLNVKHLYALTFGLGAACVGAAGAMLVPIIDVTPSIGPAYTLLAFVIVITGGLGSMPGRASRRRADRRHRSAWRPAVHAVGQEHVRLRHSGAGPPVPSAGHPRQEDVMIRHLFDGIPRAGIVLLLALFAALLVAPLFRRRLSAERPVSHSVFRLCRPGLEHHDGLCRPAFARPFALCGPGRLRGGRTLCAFRHQPLDRPWRVVVFSRLAGAVIGFLAFRFGVAGVYFAILTIAFAEFARIGFDHFAWVEGSSGFFLPVANYTENDLWNLRGSPTMFYYLMLGMAVAALVLCHILLKSRVGYYWLAIRESPEAARRSASISSSTRCTPSSCRQR
jgi:branched-chain amino acid transport system permease protein